MQSCLYPVEALAGRIRSQHTAAHKTIHKPAAASCPAATPQGSLNQTSDLLPACPCYNEPCMSSPTHVPVLNSFQTGVQERAVMGRRAEPGPLAQKKGKPPFATMLKSSAFQTASIVFLWSLNLMSEVRDRQVFLLPSSAWSWDPGCRDEEL